jgi:hypothetical protein
MEATEIHDAFLKILEDALIRVHPGNAFKGVTYIRDELLACWCEQASGLPNAGSRKYPEELQRAKQKGC